MELTVNIAEHTIQSSWECRYREEHQVQRPKDPVGSCTQHSAKSLQNVGCLGGIHKYVCTCISDFCEKNILERSCFNQVVLFSAVIKRGCVYSSFLVVYLKVNVVYSNKLVKRRNYAKRRLFWQWVHAVPFLFYFFWYDCKTLTTFKDVLAQVLGVILCP